MPYHLTKIGSLVMLEPVRAARALEALFDRLRGRTVDVAKYLGVSTSTVKRWIALLEEGGYPTRIYVETIRRRRRRGLDG